MNQRTAAGDAHGYVGEAIDPNWTAETKIADPIRPPLVEGLRALPEPGIYFGMPEEEYHAVHALSASGIKKMVASTMEFWAYSRLNPDYEEKERPWLDHGKATHCLVLEGEEEYLRRYVVELDPADFEGEEILFSTDEIKSAIKGHMQHQPVKPVGNKQALIDQLAELGTLHGQAVDLEGVVDDLKERIQAFTEEVPVKPITRVTEVAEDGAETSRLAAKDDWIDQLLALDPSVKAWKRMMDKHLAEHEGKTVITPKDERRVRIAAHMIEKHQDAGPLLKGGYPEVSIFWYCPVTGVPMKARMDYLKLQAILDVKTFSNQQGMPVNKAIERAIGNYRYNIQQVVYDQAVLAARQLVAEHGPDRVHQPAETYDAQVLNWCERWCQVEDPAKFIFIFQQSGIAPVTRVKGMPREETFKATHRLVEDIKFKWRECVERYGTLPWLDDEPMSDIHDEAIPLYATEMGGYYD